jgi:hypothetical protein
MDHFRDHLSSEIEKRWNSHGASEEPRYTIMDKAFGIYTSLDFKCFVTRKKYSLKNLHGWEKVEKYFDFLSLEKFNEINFRSRIRLVGVLVSLLL